MPARPSIRRRLLAALIALLALAGLAVTAGPAGAQNSDLHPAGFVPVGRLTGFLTGIQISNPLSTPVDVVIRLVNTNGTTDTDTPRQTIQPKGSYNHLERSGDYRAAQVLANGPVTIGVNHVQGDARQGAVAGFTRGWDLLNLPLLLQNHYGASTRISLQNTTSNTVSVEMRYFDLNGILLSSETQLIPAWGAWQPAPPNLRLPEGDGRYSAKVYVTGGTVAGYVFEEGNNQLLTYGALPQEWAGPNLSVPLVAANNYGGFTGIQVQNVGTSATTVTLDFQANDVESQTGACKGDRISRTRELPIGASWSFIQSDIGVDLGGDPSFATCRYVGSAKITSSSGSDLLAIVNQATKAAPGDPVNASAYEVVGDDVHGNGADAPLVVSNNYGLYSGVQVMNVGPASNHITFTYGANGATSIPAGMTRCPTPAVPNDEPERLRDKLGNLPAGASATVLQSGFTDPAGSEQRCVYLGSANIRGDANGKLTAIVNQVQGSGTDRLMTYTTLPW